MNKLQWNSSREILIFSFNKMRLKVSAKWREFCLCLNVLTYDLVWRLTYSCWVPKDHRSWIGTGLKVGRNLNHWTLSCATSDRTKRGLLQAERTLPAVQVSPGKHKVQEVAFSLQVMTMIDHFNNYQTFLITVYTFETGKEIMLSWCITLLVLRSEWTGICKSMP